MRFPHEHDRHLTGWKFLCGLASLCLICSVGAVANVGIASVLFADHTTCWLLGPAGAAMSAIWNYALSWALTWRSV